MNDNSFNLLCVDTDAIASYENFLPAILVTVHDLHSLTQRDEDRGRLALRIITVVCNCEE